MTTLTDRQYSQATVVENAVSQTAHSNCATPWRRPLQPWVYLLLAAILPVLAIPAFILLGRSDYFLHHGASVWVQSNDAVFDMRNRNCEVLIFGDSTAMTGINPDLVQQRTGLKTCNIAVTNAVLSVTDRLTLDQYLAHNARPRVVVVQLSPEGFEQGSREWKRTIYAEGLLELLRHTPRKQWTQMLVHHPTEATAFAGYTAGFSAYFSLKRALFYATHIRADEDAIQVRNGFFTPPSPPRTHCEPMPVSNARDSQAPRETVNAYRQYDPQHGLVLVNVAPIPACDQNLRTYQQELSGITSNTLQPLPIHLFNDQRHFTAGGSDVVSRMVADEVNQAAGTQVPEEHLASAKTGRAELDNTGTRSALGNFR